MVNQVDWSIEQKTGEVVGIATPPLGRSPMFLQCFRVRLPVPSDEPIHIGVLVESQRELLEIIERFMRTADSRTF